MATFLSKLWDRFCAKRDPLSIMIVGLDNSGKTSILNHLVSLNHVGGAAKKHLNNQSTDSIRATSPSSLSLSSSLSSTCTTSALKNKSQVTTHCDERNIMPTVGYNYERIQYKHLTITVLDFSGQSRYRNLWQEFYNGVDGIVFVIDSSDPIRFVVVRDELETMLIHPYFSTLGTMNTSNQQQNHITQTSTLGSKTTSIAKKQFVISQGKLVQTPLEGSSSSPSLSLDVVLGCSQSSSSSNSKSIKKGASNKSIGRRSKVPILFLANKTDLPSSVDSITITKALNLNQLSVERHPWLVQSTSVNLDQGITEAFDWLAGQISNYN